MQDGFVTTLRPEGSFNNIRVLTEKRELVRPEICYWKAILNALIPVLITVAFGMITLPYAVMGLCVYSLIRLRGIITWCIRVYQRHAPEELRLACVFEPSCSEYMILSINKYGIMHGGIKGVKRLKRCHLPNGGLDYP